MVRGTLCVVRAVYYIRYKHTQYAHKSDLLSSPFLHPAPCTLHPALPPVNFSFSAVQYSISITVHHSPLLIFFSSLFSLLLVASRLFLSLDCGYARKCNLVIWKPGKIPGNFFFLSLSLFLVNPVLSEPSLPPSLRTWLRTVVE